jgi:hypothetical protein
MDTHTSRLQKIHVSSYKLLIGLLPLVLLITSIGTQISVYASSNNQVSCYERGIIDGEDHPFNQWTYETCGDDYYQGFLQGCMSVEGNDRDICEYATDA